jgi:L-iditol 2-dehydrogenase
MKALVKKSAGIGNVELMEVPEPEPKSTEVKIEVKAAAICGTDIHIFYDEYPNCPPVILGHEMAGIIVEVGKDVKKVKIGDRVTSETFKYTCGTCNFCQIGQIAHCPKRLSMGVHVDGAFTKYLIQREESIHILPENIAFSAGALSEPFATAVHSIYERANIIPGDIVMISGPGPIGLLCLQAVKNLNATVILCGVTKDENRLAFGKKLGADYIINVEKDSLDLIQDLTNGLGADIAIECAGAKASLEQCINLVRKGGQLVEVGLFGKCIEVNIDQTVIKELNIKPSFTYRHETWERAMKLLKEDKIKISPLVSGEFILEDWEEAFKAVKENKGYKYLLIPMD